jgi:K+-transporting ATPase ATPase C chain
MKDLIVSVRMYLFWTLLLGLAYPLLVTGLAQGLFSRQAHGGILSRGGQSIGAELIAQKFEGAKYFWSRPSAVDFNPLPSGGSNAAPTSEALRAGVVELRKKLKAAHPTQTGEPPQDLLFASASGLDPHISPEAAEYQLARVATARQMTGEAVRALVAQSSLGRQFGIFGERRVNVLTLNLALDNAQGITAAPTPAPTPVPTAVPTASPTPVGK